MTFDVFLTGVFVVAALTGLATEAIKKWLEAMGKKYSTNTLAGYVAVMLAVAVGTAYVILTGAAINAQMMVYLIALIFLSWIAAMVGYDKVIQTVTQIRAKL